MDCVEVQKQFLIDMRVCQSLHSRLWILGFWLAHRLHQPESGFLLPMRSHLPEGPSCSRNYIEGQNSGTKEICHRNRIDIRNIQLWFLYTLIDRFWHWWVVPVLFGSERTTWRSKTFENVRMAIKLTVRVQRGLGESLLRTRQNSQLTCIGYFVILSYSGFHARQTSPETRWKVTSIWQSAGIFPAILITHDFVIF